MVEVVGLDSYNQNIYDYSFVLGRILLPQLSVSSFLLLDPLLFLLRLVHTSLPPELHVLAVPAIGRK